MKRWTTLLVICSIPFLMGNEGGCEERFLSAEQVELRLPASFRKCNSAPKSPGAGATRRETARYILALFDAHKECHGDVEAINALYGKYRLALEKAAK